MSKEEDWQPGDLALCVAETPNPFLNNPRAVPGSIHTVEAVCPGWDVPIMLVLCGAYSHHPTKGHRSSRFRKIRPHTPDEEDEETIRLLKGDPVFSDDDIGGWIDE